MEKLKTFSHMWKIYVSILFLEKKNYENIKKKLCDQSGYFVKNLRP